MKKVLFPLAAFLFIGMAAQAQEDGAKLAKQAGKALTSYNIDPAGNAAKLDEAKMKINQALATPEAQALPSAWLTKGDIYFKILDKEMAMRNINPAATFSGENDALEAYTAYRKAFESPEAKKGDKADALKGITQTLGYLINIGAEKYDAKKFDKSYDSWAAALEAHQLLVSNAMESVLNEPSKVEEQTYYTAFAAQMAQKNKEALGLYESLLQKGTNRASVYSGIYNIKSQMGDAAGANAVLAEGRKKFPEDTELLFAEINAYLQEGKLNELIDRLKLAIAKEENNISLYVTLGSVYDNLYQTATKEKNEAKSNEYFNEAKKYYEQGIAKDPKFVDAVYSLGALYYNKAAARTLDLNALPDDFSAAGIKRYDAMKKEISDLFDQALPYFQKAESLDANDLNTLIALNEIYARKEDPLSMEFKKRLEVIKGGGKNPTSYFK